jgi:hypothetical protein
MRWLESLEAVDLFCDGLSSIDHFCSEVGKVLGEPVELILDLIGKLSGMAQDQSRAWFRILRQLVQDGKNEDCSLSHS